MKYTLFMGLKLIFLLSGLFLISCTHEREDSFKNALGSKNVEILKNHEKTEFVELKIINHQETQQHILKSDDRISGYPFKGKPKILDKAVSQRLVAIVLNSNSYDYSVRRPCKTTSLYGIRFSKGSNKVEIALGVDCYQTYATYKVGDETGVWGDLLKDNVIREVQQLLKI